MVGAGAREVGRFWFSVRSFPSRVWAAAGVFGPAPARVAAIGVGGWLLLGGARSVVTRLGLAALVITVFTDVWETAEAGQEWILRGQEMLESVIGPTSEKIEMVRENWVLVAALATLFWLWLRALAPAEAPPPSVVPAARAAGGAGGGGGGVT